MSYWLHLRRRSATFSGRTGNPRSCVSCVRAPNGNWIWSVRLEDAPVWFEAGVSKDEITARRDTVDALAVLEKRRKIWARRYDDESHPKEGKQ